MKLYPSRLSGYIVASSTVHFESGTFLCLENFGPEKFYSKQEWDQYEFTSNVALIEGDEVRNEPPYSYPVVVRRSGNKALLLSSNRRVVDYLLDNIFAKVYRPGFVKVQIDIDGLIRFVAQTPSKFVFSFSHARVSAFGSALRAISFYGEDLGEASLFRNNLELMNFFICGMRKAIGGPEIIRLGGDGMVTFNVYREDNLNDVIDVLRYLSSNNFMNVEF